MSAVLKNSGEKTNLGYELRKLFKGFQSVIAACVELCLFKSRLDHYFITSPTLTGEGRAKD